MISSFIGSDSFNLLKHDSILSENGITAGFNLLSKARSLSDRKDIFDILVAELAKAEKLAPYASRLMLMMLDSGLENSSRVAFHRNHLDSIIGLCHDKNVRLIVTTVINDVGLKPTWVVSDDPNENWVVHIALGQQFNFIPTHAPISTTLTDVRFVVMDAFIESISEINTLLEECSVDKTNTILIARGYANDVVSTINLNRKRGTLNVYAFVCRFDEKGINVLKDIAIVSSARLLSTADGQLVGSYRLSESGVCRVCHLSGHQVTLEGSTNANVQLHMESLKSRIDASQDASGMLLTERLNNLLGDRVVVRTPNIISRIQLRYDLDRCLRSIRDSARWGVVNTHDAVYPANSILVANNSAASIKTLLLNSHRV